MSIKMVVGDEVLNVISAYAPQVGSAASSKQEFWKDLEEVVEHVPIGEKLVIGRDLNGHVGTSREGFETVTTPKTPIKHAKLERLGANLAQF
jgi:hypothetical protein